MGQKKGEAKPKHCILERKCPKASEGHARWLRVSLKWLPLVTFGTIRASKNNASKGLYNTEFLKICL